MLVSPPPCPLPPPPHPPPPPCADLEAWVLAEPNTASRGALSRAQAAKSARDERLKEEMMGTLKTMGNALLGKLGLSLDNFKAVKDPATGSYSISFEQ